MFDGCVVRFGDASERLFLHAEFVGVVGLEQVLSVFGWQGQRHHLHVLRGDRHNADTRQLEQFNQFSAHT